MRPMCGIACAARWTRQRPPARHRRALRRAAGAGAQPPARSGVLLCRRPRPERDGPGRHRGRMLARVANRRDIVLVDQRGTGRSAPLKCAEPAAHAAAGRCGRQPRPWSAAAGLPCPPGEAAARWPCSTTPPGWPCRTPTPCARRWGRGQHQPRRRQLRHPRRAGVHAAVSAGRAPRGAGRRGPGRHGAARLVFHRQPGGAGRGDRRLCRRQGLRHALPPLRRRWQALLASLPRDGQRHPPRDRAGRAFLD
jgi:hypothetical protein